MIELPPVPQADGTVISIARESGLLERIKAYTQVVLRLNRLAAGTLSRRAHINHTDPFGGCADEECGGSVKERHGCDSVAYAVLKADTRVAPDFACHEPFQWRAYRKVRRRGRLVG